MESTNTEAIVEQPPTPSNLLDTEESKDSTESTTGTTASSSHPKQQQQQPSHSHHHRSHSHHKRHHHHHHHHSHCSSHSAGSSSQQLNNNIIRTSTGWFQKRIHIRPVNRGCHLVTDEVVKQVPEMNQFQVGICNLHIMHTSASLTLNENWDPDVREDMEMFLLQFVPENLPFKHVCEGPDDMPAHVKAAFLGSSLTIPITEGKLCLGTWQGIWLCEHRNNAGSRKIMVTINGALKN